MKKLTGLSILVVFTIFTLVSFLGCSKKGDTTPTLPTVSIQSITKISTTSTTVTGNISNNGNSTITESGICFATTISPDITKSKIVNTVSGGIFSCALTGLLPETVYYARAYAKNTTGIAYGNELSFTTNALKFWVPDAVFRATLKQKFPTAFDLKDSLKVSNSSITGYNGSLDVSNKAIATLSGIQYFTSLTLLSCSYNTLSTLDVSKNIALTTLICSGNLLTSLDISKCISLKLLACYTNQLTSLDVSKNTALTFLDCDDNKLTTLDLSKNTALTSIFCYNNLLTNLDISTLTTVPDNLYILTDYSTLANNGNTGLTTLKVNIAIKQLPEIINIKTTRSSCTISTWNNGAQVCGNYNPITNTCP